MITLQKIGDACRVSKATVSLALRGHPRISESTRKRIEETAQRLGYQLSPLVSAHAAYVRTARPPKSATVLGYLTNWSCNALSPSKTVNQRYLEGARKRAEELGYRLDQFHLRDAGMTDRRLRQVLTTRNIVGLIVADLARADPVLDLNWTNLAAVTLGYTLRSPRLHRVCHDQYGSMGLLLAHLDSLGYRRIGLAMENRQDERSDRLVLSAFLSYQYQRPKSQSLPPFLPGEWTRENFLSWYYKTRPEAIVTVLDDVVHWLRAEGIDVPGQTGVASVCSFAREIAGIEQHFEEIAAAGVDMLISQLHTNKRGIPAHPQSSLILGSWQPGTTIRKKE